ncbi:hypothetical protein A6P54_13895 [Bacillus sp. MKU004]|nr:hypothetical protein A6P54_13895 [Bacillus sp. MKU004]
MLECQSLFGVFREWLVLLLGAGLGGLCGGLGLIFGWCLLLIGICRQKIGACQQLLGFADKNLELPTIFPIYQQKSITYRQFFKNRQISPALYCMEMLPAR